MSETVNRAKLLVSLKKFRDEFKEYKKICYELWRKDREYTLEANDPLKGQEEELREKLTEDWGRYEALFKKIGVPTITIVPSIGIPTHFFDEALDEDFQNPHKFDGLRNCVSSATKAIGLLEAVSEGEFKKLSGHTPSIFISFSFRPENEIIVQSIKDFLSSFPVSIITGTQPGTESVSEKVKRLIEGADCVIVLLTGDEEQADGVKSPSKWVQDEVAFSIGAHKKVIRFLEKGINFKPAISGDAEYISFGRENFSENFIKLAYIVNSLFQQ